MLDLKQDNAFNGMDDADRPTALNCVQPLSCHGNKWCSVGGKSQFADLPAVYTSYLPCLTHICENV